MRKNDTLNEIDEYYRNSDTEKNSTGKSNTLDAKAAALIVFILLAVTFTILMFAAISGSEIITPRVMMNIGLSITLLFGICLLVIPPILRNKKKNRCTTEVTLRCIDLNKRTSYNSDDHSLKTVTYAPVWEYDYNGETYTYAENIYSNMDVPQIGTERQGFIDPQNPSELYRPNPAAAGLVLIVGILSVLTGIFGLVIINLIMEFVGEM